MTETVGMEGVGMDGVVGVVGNRSGTLGVLTLIVGGV